MTADGLREALARLELTQRGAAYLIGVGDRTIRRWCAGDRDIPLTVERLLDLIEHIPAAKERLQWLAEQD